MLSRLLKKMFQNTLVIALAIGSQGAFAAVNVKLFEVFADPVFEMMLLHTPPGNELASRLLRSPTPLKFLYQEDIAQVRRILLDPEHSELAESIALRFARVREAYDQKIPLMRGADRYLAIDFTQPREIVLFMGEYPGQKLYFNVTPRKSFSEQKDAFLSFRKTDYRNSPPEIQEVLGKMERLPWIVHQFQQSPGSFTNAQILGFGEEINALARSLGRFSRWSLVSGDKASTLERELIKEALNSSWISRIPEFQAELAVRVRKSGQQSLAQDYQTFLEYKENFDHYRLVATKYVQP